MRNNPPPIHELCQAQARRLGLSAYAVAKATQGKVSDDHVAAFFAGRKEMGSHRLDAVLAVLGLEVTEKGK